MNLFSPAEITANYAESGAKKAADTTGRLLMLAVLAGMIIGIGGAATNTVAYAVENNSVVRLILGLLFPFALCIILLVGGELFTGNCLIVISVLSGKASVAGMLRNWAVVYIGNFIGTLSVAAACALYGQMNYSNGQLAVFTIRMASAKCALPFANAFVLSIFCNLLVCLGVMCGLSAKDTGGRVLATCMPVAFFVFSGFEHCIANMYYIPAGLLAMSVPRYAEAAMASGVDTAMLTWGNFFIRNLLPVTFGNILGGGALGAVMWKCHMQKAVTRV